MNALQIAIAGARSGFRQLVRHTPEAVWIERPGVIHLATGCPMPLFNGVALTGERALDDDLLDDVQRAFAPRGLPYSIRFERDVLPQGGAFLEERGYVGILGDAVMVLETEPTSLAANTVVRVTPVNDSRAMRAFRRAMTAGFGIPAAETERLMGDSQIEDTTIHNYLARLNGKVVGAGTFIVTEGIVSVWNVTTLRNYRRQGIGATIMLRGLADAYAAGATASMLWSSRAGYRLYERLAYRAVTQIQAFVPPS
jgi:hypothetical protein